MIHAANPVLNQAPEPFDGVGVNVSLNVDAAGMLDSAVPIVQRDSVIVPKTPRRAQEERRRVDPKGGPRSALPMPCSSLLW
jgi:hypothetical protein